MAPDLIQSGKETYHLKGILLPISNTQALSNSLPLVLHVYTNLFVYFSAVVPTVATSGAGLQGVVSCLADMLGQQGLIKAVNDPNNHAVEYLKNPEDLYQTTIAPWTLFDR